MPGPTPSALTSRNSAGSLTSADALPASNQGDKNGLRPRYALAARRTRATSRRSGPSTRAPVIGRVIRDNVNCYRSRAWRETCSDLGITRSLWADPCFECRHLSSAHVLGSATSTEVPFSPLGHVMEADWIRLQELLTSYPKLG